MSGRAVCMYAYELCPVYMYIYVRMHTYMRSYRVWAGCGLSAVLKFGLLS